MRIPTIALALIVLAAVPAAAGTPPIVSAIDLDHALENRAMNTSFGDLERFAEQAMKLKGPERLKRLFHVTTIYENQSDALAFERWNGRLTTLAKKDGNRRFQAVAALNALQHKYNLGDADIEAELDRIVESEKDWFARVHALTILSEVLMGEDKTGAALRRLSEAESIIPEGDPETRMARAEIASFRGNALAGLFDIEGSTAAYVDADFTYTEPGYPRPDFDSIYNLAQMAVNAGNESLARELAASHDRLTRRYRGAKLELWNEELCASVEDSFGKPEKVLQCLSGFDSSLADAKFVAPSVLVMRSVANARLGNQDLAERDVAQLNALQATKKYSPETFSALPRIRAEILASEGHAKEGMDTFRTYFRRRFEARARRVDAGVHQLTEELQAQLASVRRNVELQNEVIAYEKRFNFTVFAIGALVAGICLWLLRSARLLKAARRSADDSRHATERQRIFLDSIIESMPNLLLVSEADSGRITRVNKVGEELLGERREHLLGRPLSEVLPDIDVARQTSADEPTLVGEVREFSDYCLDGPQSADILVRGKQVYVSPDGHEADYLLTIAEDITEQRRAERLVTRMAHYDALTELPNRVSFNEKLVRALEDQRLAGSGCVSVLSIDLDRFKSVNDTLGHSAGDELLRAAARRMRACARESDVLARLGGDEFALIQSNVQSDSQVASVARRIVEALREPFKISGQQVTIGSSIGIAVSPRHGDNPETLLIRSDMALYHSKASGRGRFQFFEMSMDEELRARRGLEADIIRALGAGEFTLYYQPVMRLSNRRIAGCEALLRWNHPEHGLIGPDRFVSVAEDLGLIVPLGDWVLRQAMHEAVRWPSDLSVAVNVSPLQLRRPEFLSSVVSGLAQSGLAPERLELEITESVLLEDNGDNAQTLRSLRELGVKLVMDDFGTGYSSLIYFRAFPFDKIKVDRAFTKDILNDRGAMAIVHCVIDLSRTLGIGITIEGVETETQLDALSGVGCLDVQGYLISHPLEINDLQGLLSQQYPKFKWTQSHPTAVQVDDFNEKRSKPSPPPEGMNIRRRS